jgi:hypothetical protein
MTFILQIVRSWILAGHTMEGNLQRFLVIQGDSTKDYISMVNLKNNLKIQTASKYLVSPSRSRYRRQNGSVPKLLLIVFSKDLAVVNLETKKSAICILT